MMGFNQKEFLNFSKLNSPTCICILDSVLIFKFASADFCTTEKGTIYKCSSVCFHSIPSAKTSKPLLGRNLFATNISCLIGTSFLEVPRTNDRDLSPGGVGL